MLTIYHAPNTRSIRVIWLCEELALAYQVKMIDFSAEYRATTEWRALSPTGKVPVMTDGDITMFESGAMMDYLLGRYGNEQLRPSNNPALLAEYLQWHWFAEATLARPLGEIVNHTREFPGEARLPAVVEEMENRASVCLQAVADHMHNKTFLVNNEFSAADISMGYSIMLAQMLTPHRIPKSLDGYWQALQARPAFVTARGDFP